MSGLTTHSTDLAIIRLATSPMPIGRTPGFLSRAMRRHASRGEMHLGSTYDVQIHFAAMASELYRSVEAPLKAVQSLLHPCASNPDGPADPVVCSAAERMALASMESKMTGWISSGSEGRIHSALACSP